MPIYEYACTWCGKRVTEKRKVEHREFYLECPECSASCNLVPSVPASRRDHTVNP